MQRALRILLWRTLALVSLLLAVLGVFLPLLPTVPFVLLSAWAGGHGWPALETWLLEHARFGPPLRRWRERGAVPRRAKWAATLAMSASVAMLALTPQPLWLKLGVAATLAVVATWLWRRPES